MALVEKPHSPSQWHSYIESLDVPDLVNQGRVICTFEFEETLLNEGKSAEEVRNIRMMFAERFLELSMAVPAKQAGADISLHQLMFPAVDED